MDHGSSPSQAAELATVDSPWESECDSDEEAFYTDEDCPSSVEEGPAWIRRPILPVNPEDVCKLSKYDTPHMPVHDPLPAPFVQELFNLAPTLSSPIPLSAGYSEEMDMYLMAIDPATGDSLLHAIVKAGNIRGLGAMFSQRLCRAMHKFRELRPLHLFIEHRNNAGDNALHSAARSGRIELVRAVVRLFRRSHLHDGRELPRDFRWVDGGSGRHEPSGGLARNILFIDAENNSGQTPGEEALALGHTDISEYLEQFLRRAYPRGRRGEAGYGERLEEIARKDYHFLPEGGSVCR
jgi:hypothetical protein